MNDGDGVRVLGVDPGLTRCGIGIVDGAPGTGLAYVAAGVLRTASGEEVGARLLSLERELDSWYECHTPDTVAVERVFSQHNVRTVMGTAQASGIAITCAARRGIPVALYTPSEAKAAVTGNGSAAKSQVSTMVTRLLRLNAAPVPADATDALALAVCHVWRGGALHRLAAAAAGHDRLGGSPGNPVPGAAGGSRKAGHRRRESG